MAHGSVLIIRLPMLFRLSCWPFCSTIHLKKFIKWKSIKKKKTNLILYKWMQECVVQNSKVWSYDMPADLRGYPNIPNVRQITSILVRRLIKSHKKTYRNWSWKSEPYPTYAENIKNKWTIAQQICLSRPISSIAFLRNTYTSTLLYTRWPKIVIEGRDYTLNSNNSDKVCNFTVCLHSLINQNPSICSINTDPWFK